MALDLRQLRYFVAVAEEGHVTRAAERLGLQQPPLSQQIKAMEEQLGFRLFHRKPRGMELTESGAVLLEEARAILARLEQAERAALRTARGEQGRLRVGVAPTAPFHPFVPQVIRAFREAFPGISVTLDECLSRQAVQGLAEARLDAAFVRAELPDAGELTVHRMIEEPMVVALPASHALAQGETAPRPLNAFAEESFIVFARVEGPGMFDATIVACLEAGFTPRLGQEAPRITSTLGLVAAGLGGTRRLPGASLDPPRPDGRRGVLRPAAGGPADRAAPPRGPSRSWLGGPAQLRRSRAPGGQGGRVQCSPAGWIGSLSAHAPWRTARCRAMRPAPAMPRHPCGDGMADPRAWPASAGFTPARGWARLAPL